MPALVMLEGSVYSPADPFATAIVLNEGQVEWVGQDAGARSIADSSMTVQELGGRLLTPSFALAASSVSSADAPALLDDLAAAGYGYARLLLTDIDQEVPASHSAVAADYYLPLETLEEGRELPKGVRGLYASSPEQISSQVLASLAEQRRQLMLVVTDETQVGEYLAALDPLDSLSRLRISPSLEGLTALGQEELEKAKDLQVSLGFSTDFDRAGEAFNRALAAGAAVTLGSTPGTQPTLLGWELVNAAVNPSLPEHAVSARAAFAACTRAVYRAASAANPFTGQLVPGAPAHCALWAITELIVQTPDSRIAAWSTDPRARTPLLPVLADDVPRPELISLYHSGLKVG
ncbi:MAG: hypothetical protein Q4A03_01760 [Rothia sp. (in: high G+C Gram-positive bacteria)]|uniref:hypothetical protein n=1 Tax=Rothia sp. (in: high G+C Gram-positive bacteria) TaxID=1885016 RepID=UPI00270C3F3E|nr:hypothetical protein [Rothia sp. (in: high G+C Gram-positive bacteria)]